MMRGDRLGGVAHPTGGRRQVDGTWPCRRPTAWPPPYGGGFPPVGDCASQPVFTPREWGFSNSGERNPAQREDGECPAALHTVLTTAELTAPRRVGAELLRRSRSTTAEISLADATPFYETSLVVTWWVV